MNDKFFEELQHLLKLGAEGDEVLEDKNEAEQAETKDEDLPPLGEGKEVLDLDKEEPFEKALSPSNWTVDRSSDGTIIFVKKDSSSDPEAAKGKYEKRMDMDTGNVDEAIVDYVNAFMVYNKIDPSAKRHMTMRTKYGPRTVDEYDNDVSVVKEWVGGKLQVAIKWRPKDATIKVPVQFKKEIEIPDELSEKNEPTSDEMPEVEEDIPSLDDIEGMPEDKNEEEVPEEEKPEETEEEPKKEEGEETEEKPEKASFHANRIIRISENLAAIGFKRMSKNLEHMANKILLAADKDDEFEDLLGDDKEVEETEDLDEKDDKADDKEDKKTEDDNEVQEDDSEDPNVPASADVTELVNNILNQSRENGKTIFQDYIESEALGTGVLFPRDFKDLKNFRDKNKTRELEDKRKAMAERIYGDIDRIIKSEAPDDKVKSKFDELEKNALIGIISDNLEQISSEDTSGALTSDVDPSDVAKVEDQEVFEDEPEKPATSPVEGLVQKFYEMRGALTSAQRRNIADMELLEKARKKMDEDSGESGTITDDDFSKAKTLISNDLEARGDLVGSP